MRTPVLCTTVAFAIAASFAVSAEARTKRYSKSANSGQTKFIDSFFGWNNDCSFKTIDVDVVDRPDHGTVRPKVEIKKIGRAQVGSAGKCRGRKTRAISVYYRSKRGYRGRDSFKVRMKVGGQPPVFFQYKIRVR